MSEGDPAHHNWNKLDGMMVWEEAQVGQQWGEVWAERKPEVLWFEMLWKIEEDAWVVVLGDKEKNVGYGYQ